MAKAVTSLDQKNILATQYADLCAKVSKIEADKKMIKDRLTVLMRADEKIEDAEWVISMSAGKRSTTWTEKGKLAKVKFEDEALKRGLCKVTTGEPFITYRSRADKSDQ